MTRLGKDPKPVPSRPRRGRNDRWEEIYSDITVAQARELNAQIQEKIDNDICWEEWNRTQQQWYAYYWTGQRCPSLLPNNGYNLKPKMESIAVNLNLEGTDEGREISKLLEAMDEGE